MMGKGVLEIDPGSERSVMGGRQAQAGKRDVVRGSPGSLPRAGVHVDRNIHGDANVTTSGYGHQGPHTLRIGGGVVNRLLPECAVFPVPRAIRSEEHTSELQSPCNLVCRLLLAKN